MASGAFYNPLIPSTIVSNDLIEGAFSFTVDTSQGENSAQGNPNPDQYRLPLISSGTYDFVVHWGDGTTDTITTWNQAEATHTYAKPGEYLVQLVGTVTGISAGEGDTQANKISGIFQWGTGLTLTSTNGTFTGFVTSAPRMNVYAQDVPNLATHPPLTNGGPLVRMFNQMKSMTGAGANWNWPIKGQIGGMFAGTQFQGDISMWDTSDCITLQHPSNDARGLFENTPFNGDISTKVINEGLPNEYTAWDTSNVTNMTKTFIDCPKFNQNISNWDTSNVTNFFQMFFRAAAFNQPIGSWDTSNVTNMGFMMLGTTAFDQDIGNWNVGKVTNLGGFMEGKTAADFSAANLDAIFNGWIANELLPSRNLTLGSIKYTSAGVEGRALLARANSTVNVDTITDESGDVKVTTVSAHGLSTGNKVYIKDVVGTTEANGLQTVTVIDTTNFTLDGVTFTNAYVSGGNVRIGYGWSISDGGQE